MAAGSRFIRAGRLEIEHVACHRFRFFWNLARIRHKGGRRQRRRESDGQCEAMFRLNNYLRALKQSDMTMACVRKLIAEAALEKR